MSTAEEWENFLNSMYCYDLGRLARDEELVRENVALVLELLLSVMFSRLPSQDSLCSDVRCWLLAVQ